MPPSFKEKQMFEGSESAAQNLEAEIANVVSGVSAVAESVAVPVCDDVSAIVAEVEAAVIAGVSSVTEVINPPVVISDEAAVAYSDANPTATTITPEYRTFAR